MGERVITCTPKIPKMMKKAQQMSTMLPMGRREEMSVSTTSFSPGALLMTLQEVRRTYQVYWGACVWVQRGTSHLHFSGSMFARGGNRAS